MHLGSVLREVVQVGPGEEDEVIAIGVMWDILHRHGLRDTVPVEGEVVTTLVARVPDRR